jgi:hypothetical protein
MPDEKKTAQKIYVNGTIILKLILRKQGDRVWVGFRWLMVGTGGSSTVSYDASE